MISAVENSGAGGNSEFTNSAKTELINTTLKNVVWRRNRAPNAKPPGTNHNHTRFGFISRVAKVVQGVFVMSSGYRERNYDNSNPSEGATA